MPKIRVAVAGATGYAGQELVRLLARHPAATLTRVMASGASAGGRLAPALNRIFEGTLEPLSVETLAESADAVCLALPETVAGTTAPALVERGLRVFDLSGAFRLRAAADRRRWYPETPDALPVEPVYGLTERRRAQLAEARFVTCPGCYPTGALLALEPLAAAGLLEGDIIVDAKSGVSGAGKAPSERTHFSERHGSLAAYGVFAHRHAAEMEQELGQPVTFVPHLVPLDRGILETIYVRVRPGVPAPAVEEALRSAYDAAPFIRLTGAELPEIKHVAYSNFCDIGWRLDEASRRLVIVACLDNLLKGAAGQALQNLNLSYGLDERAGLL